MRKIIIPIFVPHEGCPHNCVFCDQKIISGHESVPKNDEIRKIIESYLKDIRDNVDIEIAFYGGSFTGIDIEEQERLLKVANEYKEHISGIRASTRPDCIDDKIIDLLKKYNVTTIELGVQSMDPEVLIKSGRGHTTQDVYNAVDLLKNAGIILGIQTMIGLPGSDYDKEIETCNKVIEMEPDIVRIYPTLVIKNTPLCKLYEAGKYRPLELEEAVETSAVLMEKYCSMNINVIRVGLQPTDSIRKADDGGDVVAGPYHPAFRQLAESRVALKEICKKIDSAVECGKMPEDIDEIKIIAYKYDMSVVIGQKKTNIKYLKEKYNLRNVFVVSKEVFLKGLTADETQSSNSNQYNFMI